MSLKYRLWQGATSFLCMRSSLLKSVIVTELETRNSYSGLDMTEQQQQQQQQQQ
jgi:hypothetical protein